MFQTRLAGLFMFASALSGRRRRAGALAAFVSGTLLLATVRTEAQIRGGEHEIKAAFLYNLAKFVEWPPADPSDQLVIGVVGSDFFGSTLRHVVEGKSVQGREIVVRRLRRDDDLRACDILFVSALEARHLADMLSRLEAAAVLTVGETPEFLRDGGHVRFYVENNRVRVEIDGARAAGAGLTISSQLLSLADRRKER